MIRVALTIGVIVAIYFAVTVVRGLEPSVRRKLGRWLLWGSLLAVLFVVLARVGYHWIAVLGAGLFAVLRRSLPLLLRALPFLSTLWRRRGAPSGSGRAGGGGPSASDGGPMTREEALAILGLQPGATPEEIVSAYRQLMQKVHPDKPGGSTYLASQLNRAKKTLLG